MIQNAHQYQVSKDRLSELNAGIEKLHNDNEKSPLQKEMLITSLEIARNDIQKEIDDYEKLNCRKL